MTIPIKNLTAKDMQSNRYKVAKMQVLTFSRAPVDIIIPMHGQYDKVGRLIHSIILATKSNPYQITVVDDASPNRDFIDEFKEFDNHRPQGTEPILKFVRSDVQLGFGGACKLGYDRTKQPWCLFIHSDCVIEDPNWMWEMGRSLMALKAQGVRMVSAKNNLSYSGCPSSIRGTRNDHISDVVLDEGSFLPLFCFMCHRQLFQKTQGFIKEYPYGTYEDEEFAFRMRKFGFKQAICGKSWVRHDGGTTFNALLKEKPEIQAVLDANRDRCISDIRLLMR